MKTEAMPTTNPVMQSESTQAPGNSQSVSDMNQAVLETSATAPTNDTPYAKFKQWCINKLKTVRNFLVKVYDRIFDGTILERKCRAVNPEMGNSPSASESPQQEESDEKSQFKLELEDFEDGTEYAARAGYVNIERYDEKTHTYSEPNFKVLNKKGKSVTSVSRHEAHNNNPEKKPKFKGVALVAKTEVVDRTIRRKSVPFPSAFKSNDTNTDITIKHTNQNNETSQTVVKTAAQA